MIELIFSLLVVSGIAAFLAAALEAAHRYLTDYGEVNITINEQKEMPVQGGSPLLFTLMEQGIFIPSACGGKGTCSYCKVRVTDGGGPVLPTETPWLSKQEIEDQIRLSCQVKVKNDLKIEIPEELFLVREYRVRLVRSTRLTPIIKGLELEILEPEEGLTFKPGQYVQFQVPAYELNKESDFRAFSIASSGEDPRRLELMITKAPEGLVSIYIHEYMKEGDETVLRGPFGDFYLRRESDREIVLIATGSGLAPVKAIIHQLIREGITRKTSLLFGARTREDLIYPDWLKSLEDELPDFSYLPVLSNLKEDDPWDGHRGRITDLVDQYVEKDAPLDAYICGAPIVVELCEKLLVEKKGIPPDRIFYDKFA